MKRIVFVGSIILASIIIVVIAVRGVIFECKPMGDTPGTVLDISAWVQFGCQNRIGYFTSSTDYNWVNDEGKKAKVFSVGKVTEGVNIFDQALGSNFYRYHMIELRDDVSIKNINALLNKRETKSNFVYTNLVLLRALTHEGFSYEAFIMVGRDQPEWVILCKNYCNYTEPEYFKVVKNPNNTLNPDAVSVAG